MNRETQNRIEDLLVAVMEAKFELQVDKSDVMHSLGPKCRTRMCLFPGGGVLNTVTVVVEGSVGMHYSHQEAAEMKGGVEAVVRI